MARIHEVRRDRRVRTTIPADAAARPADLVKRDFTATRPNQLWVVGSYDNALAETVNGLYKDELVYWEGAGRNAHDVELATLDWVEAEYYCRNQATEEPLAAELTV